MTLPPSDAQSSRILPHRPNRLLPAHSISPQSPPASFPLPSSSSAEHSPLIQPEHAVPFPAHSLDLTTGGLKTLTAKRELPPLLDRRPSEKLKDAEQVSRSYTFALLILACVLLMLIGGGVVLFVALQP